MVVLAYLFVMSMISTKFYLIACFFICFYNGIRAMAKAYWDIILPLGHLVWSIKSSSCNLLVSYPPLF